MDKRIETLRKEKLEYRLQLENIKEEYEILLNDYRELERRYKDIERRYRKYRFTENPIRSQFNCPHCDKSIIFKVTNNKKELYGGYSIECLKNEK